MPDSSPNLSVLRLSIAFPDSVPLEARLASVTVTFDMDTLKEVRVEPDEAEWKRGETRRGGLSRSIWLPEMLEPCTAQGSHVERGSLPVWSPNARRAGKIHRTCTQGACIFHKEIGIISSHLLIS